MSQATQSGSVAIGLNSQSTGVDSIAIGTNARATGSVAVGANASASNGGAAFGDNTTATGTNSAAFGNGATATAPNSVALGGGSIANQANTVSVGSAGNERRITNVAAGVSPTDAVNVGQLTSATSGFTNALDNVNREARRGIAATAALAPVMTPSAPGKTTVSVNSGFYRSEVGLGVGLAHRLNTSIPVVVHGSFATSGSSDHVGRVGAAVEF